MRFLVLLFVGVFSFSAQAEIAADSAPSLLPRADALHSGFYTVGYVASEKNARMHSFQQYFDTTSGRVTEFAKNEFKSASSIRVMSDFGIYWKNIDDPTLGPNSSEKLSKNELLDFKVQYFTAIFTYLGEVSEVSFKEMVLEYSKIEGGLGWFHSFLLQYSGSQTESGAAERQALLLEWYSEALSI